MDLLFPTNTSRRCTHFIRHRTHTICSSHSTRCCLHYLQYHAEAALICAESSADCSHHQCSASAPSAWHSSSADARDSHHAGSAAEMSPPHDTGNLLSVTSKLCLHCQTICVPQILLALLHHHHHPCYIWRGQPTIIAIVAISSAPLPTLANLR